MQLLQPSINVGLNEMDFWTMTVAEVQRYLNGAVWRMKSKAQFDYNLANLIGISVGRMIATEITFPTIAEAYPGLFEEEVNNAPSAEEIAMENSKNRFMEFALKHNSKMQKGE